MTTKDDIIRFAKSGYAASQAAKQGAQTKRAKSWQQVIEDLKTQQRLQQMENIAEVCDDMFATLMRATDAEITLHATRLHQGLITPEQFERDMKATFRASYDQAAQIGKSKARGKWLRLSDRDVRAVDRERREEQRFLKGFIADINGKYKNLTPEQFAKRVQWRSNLYTNALGGEMNDSWLAHLPREQDCEWRLGPHEHCEDCLEEAAQPPRKPWQFNRVPRDGSTRCVTRCGCEIVTVITDKVQAVSPSGAIRDKVVEVVLQGAKQLGKERLINQSIEEVEDIGT
jgi:hypothetical protein